jgi:hypothetical protein
MPVAGQTAGLVDRQRRGAEQHALAAAGSLPSKAAVRQLVVVILAGMRR